MFDAISCTEGCCSDLGYKLTLKKVQSKATQINYYKQLIYKNQGYRKNESKPVYNNCKQYTAMSYTQIHSHNNVMF